MKLLSTSGKRQNKRLWKYLRVSLHLRPMWTSCAAHDTINVNDSSIRTKFFSSSLIRFRDYIFFSFVCLQSKVQLKFDEFSVRKFYRTWFHFHFWQTTALMIHGNSIHQIAVLSGLFASFDWYYIHFQSFCHSELWVRLLYSSVSNSLLEFKRTDLYFCPKKAWVRLRAKVSISN